MKKRKWKILKISSLLIGGLAVVTTPIVSVSCSSSLTTKPEGGNQNNKPSQPGGGSGNTGGSGSGSGGAQTQTISPKINSKINLSGNISSILGLTGNKTEVQEQLQTFVNSDKSIVVSNYDEIKNKGKDVKVDVNVTSGDDSSWGNTPYESWSSNLDPSHIKNWMGYDSQQKSNEKNITVDSKKSLKDFLSKNIKSIATNAGVTVSNETVELADASPIIDETNGNLLVPILLKDSGKKDMKTLDSKSFDTNKYVISIPQSNIFLDIKTSITATIVDKQTKYYSLNNHSKKVEIVTDTKPVTTTSEFDFDAEFNNSNIQATKMQSDLDLPKLEQKEQENKIEIYEKIKDLDILKTLKWIDASNESQLTSHTDGSPIDVSLLKLDDIKSKLNLEDGYTPETIIFNMKQRDPSKDDYNGQYNIEVVGLKHSKNSSELKTMNFYKTVNSSTKTVTNTLLQLNVPNAYVLDTTVNASNGKFKNIAKFPGNNPQFGIGIKGNNGQADTINCINQSLQKTNTWNKFLKKLNQSLSEWHYQVINGFNITFHNFNWTDHDGNLMTFYLTLKPGFKLINEAHLNNKDQYNTDKSIQETSGHIEFKFNIDASSWDDQKKSAIGEIADKTPDDLENWYTSNDEWNGIGNK